MPRDPREFKVGDRVPGTKWVVRGKLGEGGMGLVLDVVKEPGIQGAMKVMLPAFAKRPEFVNRFFGEVRLLAQLRHPNIVQVFDYDQLDDGTPYVVMERLFGVPLRAGLRNLRAKGTPISAKLTYEVTRQLCEGLFRAHSNTPVIVHRDVKPENIFFHQPEFADAVVKVIDFGIAAVLDGTRDRRALGTPRHMAPEQIRAEPVSPATDVYAAALVLYEMLTGRFPWDVDLRSELALVEAHLHCVPFPPSKYADWVPPRVDEWVLRALSKDAKERPQDAYEFISKLYELQFVNDGTSDSVVDINTTAPTLARLAEAVEGGGGPATRLDDSEPTRPEAMSHPVEGPSLEAAPLGIVAGITDSMSPPKFSAQTIERAALATTRLSSGVDRRAATQTASPPTRPFPKTDTAVLSGPVLEPTAAPMPVNSLPPPTAAETPVASTSTPRSPIDVPQRWGVALLHPSFAPMALGAVLVCALFVLLVTSRNPRAPQSSSSAAREEQNQAASAATRIAAPSPAASQIERTPVAATGVASAPTTAFATSLAVAVAPESETQPPLTSASGVQPRSPPARRLAHAAAKTPATAHVPDDGRDLLYLAP